MVDEKSIFEVLPQIPYIVDQVGAALAWAKEALDEGTYNKTLATTLNVAKYVKKISDSNFFKTHLVIASILSNIEGALESEKFTQFDSASKAIEETLKAITVSTESLEKHGCFTALSLLLVPLASKNEQAFAVAMINLRQDVEEIIGGMEAGKTKAPITSKDYITILGYVNVIANIRLAHVTLLDETYEEYNKLVILLDGLKY